MSDDRVRDWMKSPIIVVDPDSSVSHALTLMRRRHIRSLVVDLSEPGKLAYGIVTSTDIRNKIMAAERDPAKTLVRAIMTTPVVTAHPDWTLKECSIKMQELNVHHLPVADDTGTIMGMISDTDLFIAAEERGWQ
ncbi:MAG: CBS domain-containing protein [Anaerolineales bacterium]